MEKGLCELHTFKTLRFRRQSHIPRASAASVGSTDIAYHPKALARTLYLSGFGSGSNHSSLTHPMGVFQISQTTLSKLYKGGLCCEKGVVAPMAPSKSDRKPVNSETVVCTDGSGCCTHGSGCCTHTSGCFLVFPIASFAPKKGFRPKPPKIQRSALKKQSWSPATQKQAFFYGALSYNEEGSKQRLTDSNLRLRRFLFCCLIPWEKGQVCKASQADWAKAVKNTCRQLHSLL